MAKKNINISYRKDRKLNNIVKIFGIDFFLIGILGLFLLYMLLLLRAKYYILYSFIFVVNNCLLLLLIMDSLKADFKASVEDRKYYALLLIPALICFDLSYGMITVKALAGFKIEIIDLVSFLVNTLIGIGFIVATLVKSFYNHLKRHLVDKPPRKVAYSRLTFISVFLCFIALVSVSAIAIFNTNISYLGAVTPEQKGMWDLIFSDWKMPLLLVSSIGIVVGFAIFVEYWYNINLIPFVDLGQYKGGGFKTPK